MSNIDAQIKALQLKKQKIDYVSYVADLIKSDTKCIDFKDVQKEVVSQIEPFLLNLMGAIENDLEADTTIATNKFPLTTDQVEVLKKVADKLLVKAPQQDMPVPQVPKPRPVAAVTEVSNNDKMNFALNNRHLANKNVQVINDQNVTITGTVVGLDAPFVVVKTDTGPTIKVPLEKVVL